MLSPLVLMTKLLVERKTRILGNVMFGPYETEFEEPVNYSSQVDQLCRSRSQVSVSYTHLDVYKRQGIWVSPWVDHHSVCKIYCYM